MNAPQAAELVTELRQLAEAYPETVFGPVTPEEVKEHASLITRNSAAMGRHFAPWFTRSADEIEQLLLDREQHAGNATAVLQAQQELACAVERIASMRVRLREAIDIVRPHATGDEWKWIREVEGEITDDVEDELPCKDCGLPLEAHVGPGLPCPPDDATSAAPPCTCSQWPEPHYHAPAPTDI